MHARLLRSAIALTHRPVAWCPQWTSSRFSQTHSAVTKRPSRRRYAASNTSGRVGQAKDLVELMKAKPKDEAKAFFDSLLPRDKLDVVRLLHEKKRKRRSDHSSSALPKHYSVIFEKNYFFKEADLKEESTLGRGPGGQATNRRMQTAIVRHVPSGIIVKFSRFPSLWLNRRAARELLHLRLEEHLLGPTSRLGKARVAREKQQRHRQRTVEYLTKKGKRLRAREAHECDWMDFQNGTSPLPEAASRQMGLSAGTQPVTIALLFGAECNTWWPKLKAAVDAATDETLATSDAPAQVPLMLRYLFPVAYAEASKSQREQLERCKASEAVQANVARAFVCFCELFGLRLRETAVTASAPIRRCALQKDGLNWVEYRSRMYEGDQLTRVAWVCWPHVYVSLRELGMLAEARAIVVFLKKEAKAGSEAEARTWAHEALKRCAQVMREVKASSPQQTSIDSDSDERESGAETRVVAP